MTTIRLMGSPLSPFVKKVQDALALKKIDHELVEPRGPGDFKRWNPQTRKMPVLEIEGRRIYDSTLICRHLDEHFAEPPLFASDPAARAGQRLLEDWSDESLYWSIMALRWSKEHQAATVAEIAGSLPGFLRPVAGVLLRRQIGAQAVAQGMGRLPLDVVVRELGERFDDLVARLGDRPFFYSDQVSVADLAIAGMLETGMGDPSPEVRPLVEARPALTAHLERVQRATGRSGT